MGLPKLIPVQFCGPASGPGMNSAARGVGGFTASHTDPVSLVYIALSPTATYISTVAPVPSMIVPNATSFRELFKE